jgi:hypothetical protein
LRTDIKPGQSLDNLHWAQNPAPYHLLVKRVCLTGLHLTLNQANVRVVAGYGETNPKTTKKSGVFNYDSTLF